MKKQKRRKEKGITLMALVVTIIVLIILAGVTLNIVLDQNGIISKTQQAEKEWNEAEIAEKEAILKAEAKILEFQNNIEHEMLEYYIDEVPIPKGFVYKEGTKETGLIIINKEDGNEFIWVPKSEEEAEEDLKNTLNDLLLDNPDYPEGQKLYASIKEYGGYYAARYQAGADVEITSLEQADQTVYSQAGKHPYIHVSAEKIIRLSKSIYPETEENTTGAVSTYTVGGATLWDINEEFGYSWIPGELSSLLGEHTTIWLMPMGYVATERILFNSESGSFQSNSRFSTGSLEDMMTMEFNDITYTFRPLLYIKLPE